MTQNTKQLSNALGEIKNYQKTSNGLEGETISGEKFRISVYTERMIRVHLTKAEDFDVQSYAVIASPTRAFDLIESDDQIVLTTSKLSLLIDKYPMRVTLLNKDNKVVNEDDKAFGTSWIGDETTTYKKLQEGERFIGMGEKTGPLDRRGHGYQHWNTDSFAYNDDSDPLYCSTPFYIGIHNQLCYGIYLDNSHKSHFNFGASNNRFSSFAADFGDMNYYLIYDDNLAGILEAYTELTGRMTMPPMWSIGYQQCRYSYYPDKEILNVARTFRDKEIPADVIVLDIHYMQKFKIFSWDSVHFPDPKGMMEQLKAQGFHIVVMCDPGIKIEEGYGPYESGKDDDVFVKYPDGTYYSGEVWPGWCHFPDFTSPKAREWWKEKLKSYADIGVDGYWNDMNEIATWGQMLPALMEFEFEGNKTTAREARNVYGFQMARSTYEGTKELLGGKRPFNLTRSGFSGIQRYSAVWTGDNVANDEHMMLGVRLVNSLGLAGIAFTGPDVGGFVGNAHEHLFARWVQIGAFTPFFRGHSMVNSRDSEPWAYGEEVEEISRNYIRLRYKMMPYLYSSFYETTKTGIPVARSLAIEYTYDDQIYNLAYQHEFLFGQSILIAPVESSKTLTKLYLPQGTWYEFFSDNIQEGSREIIAECPIEQLPVFVKSSAIIPMCPNVKSNTKELGDLLELHIYKGQDDNSFEYYEDDGESYEYEMGNYHLREIIYSPSNSEIIISQSQGNFASRFRDIKVCLHGFDNEVFFVNGQNSKTLKEDYRYIEPISNFDPVGAPGGDFKIEGLRYIEFENLDSEIKITW